MNSIFEKYQWLKYVVFSFLVALGVLVIILACLKTSSVPDIINITLSIALMIMGVGLLVISLTSETHKPITVILAISAVLIALGIITLVARFGLKIAFSTNFIVYIQAIFLIVLGAVALLKAIFLIVYREKPLYVFIMFAVATLAVILGILGLCYVPKLISAAYIILGILLVIAGILGIVFSILAAKKKADK